MNHSSIHERFSAFKSSFNPEQPLLLDLFKQDQLLNKLIIQKAMAMQDFNTHKLEVVIHNLLMAIIASD